MKIFSFLNDWAIYKNQNLNKAFFLLGAILAGKWSINILSRLWSFVRFGQNLADKYGKGSYVVITGASDGIGKQFSFSLAQRGFNIVLVARNEEKVKTVKRELTEKFPQTDVKIVIADFSQSTEENFFSK